jgi:hypothetical protein
LEKIVPRRKQWVFDPNAGGIKIPESVKRDVEQRINAVAEKHFKGKYIRLDIRFRGQFCYIDAFCEPQVSENWPPEDWPEAGEEYIDRLRNTPTHLCRLRYFGDDRRGFAFYTYSNEKYELSVYPNGQFFGKPEDAFLASAVYLNG